MTKKQIEILSALGGAVAILIIVGLFLTGVKDDETAEPTVGQSAKVEVIVGGEEIYSSEIPIDVTTTTPAKNEAPASANVSLDTKIRFYDLKASASGFEPNQIAVISGDSLDIEFTAVDGDYDLDFPYLGAYFSVVRQGETKKIPFDTSTTGTFKFFCRDFCPESGKIQGTLVVLPR